MTTDGTANNSASNPPWPLHGWRWRALLFSGLLLLMAWSASRVGFSPIDDSYITMRYAAHAAAGKGLVYNEGEWVLGYSSPLYTLLLSLLALVGAPLPPAALVVGFIGGALVLALLILLSRSAAMEPAGWAAAALLSVNHLWSILLTSGMETTLATAAILALFLAATEGRWRLVGALGAITVLLRYDSAIAASVALGACWPLAGWRVALRQCGIAVAIYLPWVVFATVAYGSPVPQTVVAKTFLYQLTWQEKAEHFSEYARLFFALSPIALALAIVGFLGLFAIRRRLDLLGFWVCLFTGMLFIKGAPILFFPWYILPVAVGLVWLQAAGLWLAVSRLDARIGCRATPGVFAAAALVLIGFQMGHLLRGLEWYGRDIAKREDYYRCAAESLAPRVSPGSSVMTMEVGTFGWYLPQARIINAEGLLTPRALELRKRDRWGRTRGNESALEWATGTPELYLTMLREFQPDFVAARTLYMPWPEMEGDRWLNDHYERLSGGAFEEYGLVVLRRRLEPVE